jgi:cobalt-zinc-cadmium efflux system outer membrane protein
MGGRVIAGWVRALVVAAGPACVAGCETAPVIDPQPRVLASRLPARNAPARQTVIPASHAEPAIPAGPTSVDDLVALAVARNPRLAKATFAIDAAHGRYIQAGLYPNPELAINWDEVGDRTGPGGILTAPRLSQTVVTGRKLSLSQAVAATEVDQATLGLIAERYAVIGSVRAAFYDVYILERRIQILDELLRLADEAVKAGKAQLENKQIAAIDLMQLETERARFRADAETAKRELPAARRALAAAVGDPRMPLAGLTGPYDEVPVYDPERSLDVVLASHPEVQSARVGVERAQAALRRARAEVIPDVSVYTGYMRQGQNRSNDFALGVSAPIPVWNRNQGAIRAAQAEVGMATQEVARAENDLANRVAAAFRTYDSARRRAELYRTEVLPKLQETADLLLKAFKAGQFEFFRVIQTRRALAEAGLEYNKALHDAWKAAAQLSELLLEESWPDPPQPGPMPLPTPPTGKPGP